VSLPTTNEGPDGPLRLEDRDGGVVAIQFSAMAGPCELLLHTADRDCALELGRVAAAEAWRIEAKYSRYRSDSVISRLHGQCGTSVLLDEESAGLIDFAAQCFEISDGLFDITSGILRRVWKFDGSGRVPDVGAVQSLLARIGFNKLLWRRPYLTMPVGMELDLGGIGKEYAVDRAYDLLMSRCPVPFLVNFGGDLRASRPMPQGPWRVGIERPGADGSAAMMLEVEYGALATSGDSHRFLLHGGVRYGHVLDPRTGWPVQGAHRSITVAASSCTEAGLLSTVAMLKGKEARQFLDEQSVRYWLLDV
jgi:thiamine biosynthesis lipoprotein